MSEPYSTQGFVLARQPYGDSSLIVRWLTPDLGRISTMVKGAARPKSSFAGQIDLFYLCQIVVVPPKSGELYQLREAQLQQRYAGLTRDWLILAALQYFAELIAAVTEEGAAIPEDFALFQRAVQYLDVSPLSLRALRKFEFVLLENNGYALGPQDQVERVLSRAHLTVPKSRARLAKELQQREAGSS